MADTKISALAAASALTGSEEFAANQGGVSKKATATQVKAFANTFPSGDPGESAPALLQQVEWVPGDQGLRLVGPNLGGGWADFVLAGSATSNYISLLAGTVNVSTMGNGDIGTGTFRNSIDARIASQSTDSTEVTALVNSVAPTVTMTSGDVGTGTFRDSVRSAVMGNYTAGAWTTYTPTFTAATTNPTLGNFTRAGRYTQSGKTVTFSVVITATAASGFGTGTYSFGLPVAARAIDEVVVKARQGSPVHTYTGSADTTTSVVLTLNSTDVNMNPTNSGMANGTIIRISGTYEAA